MAVKLKWPASCHTITQHFGNASSRYVSGHHTGLDIGCRYGSPIYAATDGVVTFAGWNGPYGREVRVKLNDAFTTSYHHMSAFAVHRGQNVSAGTVLGYIGSTGNSTGPHLHFEVRVNGKAVDPEPYLSGATSVDQAGFTTPVGNVFSIPGAVVDAFKWMTNTENWYRVGLVLLGAILLLIAFLGVAKTRALGTNALGTVKSLAKGKGNGGK